ncbi:DUF2793 domain-containing protein [Rhizobium sp. RAF56]|uniref:DUF2793 domain-containing protein n=1 Tax=Rhizobium sp. RAF56 TaxID=3233062 RepID=UPI003F95A7BC
MSDETTNLALPYILPSQAQKHVTHNEALQRLDAAVQLTIAASLAAPPLAPSEGAAYLVSTGASGAWLGKSGVIAFFQDGDWLFLQPRAGWRAWFAGDSRLRVFTGAAWTEPSLPASGSMQSLGINATADTSNRLAVAAAATLFSNAGNGHQIKVNKAAAADTASLLFQTGWSGRAEMGTAGDDSFSIKISPDGSAWRTGLAISPQGVVSMPNRPLVRASLTSGPLTPAAGSQTGFSTLAANQGGFALADAISASAGNRLSVPVTGSYLLLLQTSTLTSNGHTVSLVANGSTVLTVCGAPTTNGALRQSAAGIATLNAGDRLSLLHGGTAQFEFGSGKTEIMATLL